MKYNNNVITTGKLIFFWVSCVQNLRIFPNFPHRKQWITSINCRLQNCSEKYANIDKFSGKCEDMCTVLSNRIDAFFSIEYFGKLGNCYGENHAFVFIKAIVCHRSISLNASALLRDFQVDALFHDSARFYIAKPRTIHGIV